MTSRQRQDPECYHKTWLWGQDQIKDECVMPFVKTLKDLRKCFIDKMTPKNSQGIVP